MVALTWILVAARLIIAIQLTRVGRRHQLPNLFWLAGFFFITGIGDIFFTFAPITTVIWPFFLSVGLGEVVMVMFIQKTFYQDRKSPYLIFMVIALVFLVANMTIALFIAFFSPFNWLWLIWVGYQAYKKIATNPMVEDWIKARYKLVIAYSIVALAAPLYTILSFMAFGIPSLAAWLFNETNGPLAGVVILVFTTIGIALEYLAWVMPEGYRNYLNRNYQPPAQDTPELELSEEELMRKFKDHSES